jgi:23S rRNA (cytidine1920-2'-O)/16S rRNA (cytidine1409-2'-O)-methyltransferase
MRLDLYITKYFDIQSRNKAHELIKNSKVKVNNKIITKPSYKIEQDEQIILLEEDFFVSRAAYKLKYFLEEIDLKLDGLNALDIGSSTGGFTQILLNNNIANVSCVDVGTNQLHEKIKYNKKISMYENTDIRKFNSNKIFDIVTCDVSFISILNILDDINRLSSNNIIILYKPQFEVGKEIKRDRNGVVQDQNAIDKAKEQFIQETKKLNWKLIYNSYSKLEGKEGNREELYYFCKK